MSRVLNTDTLLGATGTLAAGFLLLTSYRASESVFVLPGDAPPFLVAQMFLYLLGAVSLAILVSGLRDGGVHFGAPNWLRIALSFATFVAATVLMKPVGFLVVAPLAVFATILILGYPRPLIAAAVSIGVVGFLYIVLVRFAQMPLPRIPGLGI